MIDGYAEFGYKENERVSIFSTEIGKYYYIPPFMPHQIKLKGNLAIFYSTALGLVPSANLENEFFDL